MGLADLSHRPLAPCDDASTATEDTTMTILPTISRALPAPLVNAPDDDTAWLPVADVHAAIRLCLVRRDLALTSRQIEEAEVLHLALATVYRTAGGLIGERDERMYYHAPTLHQAARRLA